MTGSGAVVVTLLFSASSDAFTFETQVNIRGRIQKSSGHLSPPLVPSSSIWRQIAFSGKTKLSLNLISTLIRARLSDTVSLSEKSAAAAEDKLWPRFVYRNARAAIRYSGSSVFSVPNDGLQTLCVNLSLAPLCRNHSSAPSYSPTNRMSRSLTLYVRPSCSIRGDYGIYACICLACNPLIMDVKALIYQLRVRAAFEGSPSLVIECVLRLGCVHARFLNSSIWSNEDIWHQSKILFTDAQDLFIYLFFGQTVTGFVWWQLFHLHKRDNYLPSSFLVTSTAAAAARLFSHIIFPIIFSSDSSNHFPPRCQRKAHWQAWAQYCNQHV